MFAARRALQKLQTVFIQILTCPQGPTDRVIGDFPFFAARRALQKSIFVFFQKKRQPKF